MREQELFSYIKDNYLHDLMPTGTYCAFDGVSVSGQILVELKCRAKHYEDMMIERKKYRALLSEASQLDCFVYYICSTPKGIFCWGLLTIKEPVWYENETMPKSTEFIDTGVTSKAVGYLHTSTSTTL